MSDYAVTVVDESIAVTVDVTPESTPIVIEVGIQGPEGIPGPQGDPGVNTWGSLTGTLSDQTDLQNALDDKANTADLGSAAYQNTSAFDAAGLAAAVQSNLNDHEADTANPHQVTKAQVGLDEVDNTSDANKPISSATQTALNNKLDTSAFVPPGSTTQILFNNGGAWGADSRFKWIAARNSLEVMGAPSYGNNNLAIGINTAVGIGTPLFSQYVVTATSIPDPYTVVVTGDHTVGLGVGTYTKVVMSGVATYTLVKIATYSAGSTTLIMANQIAGYYYGPGAFSIYTWDGIATSASSDECSAFMGASVAGYKSFGHGRASIYGDGCFGVDTGSASGSTIGGANIAYTSVGTASSFISSDFGLQYNGINLAPNFMPGQRVKIMSPGGTYYKRVVSFNYTGSDSQVVFDSVLTGTYYGAGNFSLYYASGLGLGQNAVSIGRSNTVLGTDSFAIGKSIINNFNRCVVISPVSWAFDTEDDSIFINTNGSQQTPNFFMNSNNRIGIGNRTPLALLDVRSNSSLNFAISYDATNYMKVYANYNGGANHEATGSGPFYEWKIATVSRLILANSGRLGVAGVAAPTARLHVAQSLSDQASIRMNSGVAPTSLNDGDLWNDVVQKCIGIYYAGVKQYVPGGIFSQTANGTIANSVAETAISSTGVGTLTLPANFFVAGKSLRISGSGFHGATASPNLTIKIKFGSTVILTTGAIVTGNDTNGGFSIYAEIACRTTGVSGTVMAQGSYVETSSTSARAYGMVNTAATTVNTTTTQTITVTAQWGTANALNTITLTNLDIEVSK